MKDVDMIQMMLLVYKSYTSLSPVICIINRLISETAAFVVYF